MKKLFLLTYLLGVIYISHAQNHHWTKRIGGIENEWSFAVTADANGAVYTAGTFSYLADFDPGTGTHTLTPLGQWDLFLNKLDSAGNFVWNKRIGGTKMVWPMAVKIGSQGEIYVTGQFEGSADFDPGAGSFSMATNPNNDANVFILKLDPAGNFLWAKSFGSKWLEYSNEIVFDGSNNLYLTGSFQDTADFDPGPSVYTLTSVGGNFSAFVSKLDAAGNFLWARSFKPTVNVGGSSAHDLCVDLSGDVSITGAFRGIVDFDPGLNTFTLASVPTAFFGDSDDIFVVRLNSSGNFIWAVRMGDKETDGGTSIVNDVSGNMYLTGTFGGTIDIDPGVSTYNLISTGGNEIFVCRLSSSGVLSWAGSFGGNSLNYEWATSAELQPGGDLFLTGMVNGSPDFDIGSGTFTQTALAADGNIFISKLNTNGNFLWATILPGKSFGTGQSIHSAPGNIIYTTGYFADTVNFDPGFSNFKIASNIRTDIFIHKRGPSSTVGIIENASESDLNLFPNPATGQVVISGSKGLSVVYTLVDQVGREVIHGECPSGTAVDISKLKAGLYFVHLSSGERTRLKKLVVR